MTDFEKFKKFLDEMNIGYSIEFENIVEDIEELDELNMCIDEAAIDPMGGRALCIMFDKNREFMYFSPFGE